MVLARPDPGVEDLKIGGAIYVWLQYKDDDGSLFAGDYYKWANTDDFDGAGGFMLSTALLITSFYALF